MAFSSDFSNLHLDDQRPLFATYHDNGSLISLESSGSQTEDIPGSFKTRGPSPVQGTSTDGMAASTPQGRPNGELTRTSDHRMVQSTRRPVPLKLPETFCKPPAKSSDAHVSSHRSRDEPPRQAVQPPRSAPALQWRFQERQECHVEVDRNMSGRASSLSSTISPPDSSLANNELPPLPSDAYPPSHATHPKPPSPSKSEYIASPLERPPLLGGRLALPRRMMCHSAQAQQLMEALEISWGVQYELARGVLSKTWTWDEVTFDVLERLQGSNYEAAPQVHTVMSEAMGKDISESARTDARVTNLDTWREYDREQDAILEGQSRGLGLRGKWKDVPDWYGGRIEQVVKLLKSNDGTFTYSLLRPALKKSTRFARFLGSRRILKIKLPKDLRFNKNSGISEHLSGPFVLCGRVYVPFASKEGSVYMMEVNEDEDRRPDRAQGDDKRMSLGDFIQWHNPLTLNENQALSKWISRLDLGLSTTVPVLQFDPVNITFIDDICAPHNEGEKVPTEKILTDGCGFINGAALTLIAQRLKLPSRPIAVQGRIAGSKGLWILHQDDRSHQEPPRIWIRDSQRKVKLPSLEKDSAHVIFDVITQSNHIKVPARLNYQLVMNLAENGVDSQVFESLAHEGLSDTFSSLTRWDGPGAMPLLWHTVNGLGSATRTRLQVIARGLERAIGLSTRFEMDRRDEEDGLEREDEDSSLNSDEKSLYQTVLELIQAGFKPQSAPFLFEKMRYVVQQAMNRYLDKYHLEVRQSADAFIVPDPFNVLEEGQIHFKSSQELADPLTEMNIYCVRGPVLVSRNPITVGSDIQKVEAVEHELLADYVNVVVFSTKGSRSLASLLAGGDYDGDMVMVNWAPSLVEKFKPPKVVDKPDDLEKKYFEGHVERVTSFCQRHESSTPDEVQKSFLSAVLNGLGNDYIGTYWNFFAYAAYTRGYSDTETIRLAHMFTTCLDSRKTGHRVRQDVFTKDSRQYGWGLPECMSHVEKYEWKEGSDIRRSKALDPFVLESLRDFGTDLADTFLSEYEKLGGQAGVGGFTTADRHLIGPHQRIVQKLSEMESLLGGDGSKLILEARRELSMIENHVDKIKSEWPKCFSPTGKKKSGSMQKRGIDELRGRFVSGPDAPYLSLLGDIPAIRASYAYKQCRANKPTFAFSIALEDICRIKAQESDGIILDRELAELMTIPKTAVRTLSALRALT